jgi:hypothetical protein
MNTGAKNMGQPNRKIEEVKQNNQEAAKVTADEAKEIATIVTEAKKSAGIEKESTNLISMQAHSMLHNKDVKSFSLDELTKTATELTTIGVRYFKTAVELRKREKSGEILQDFETAIMRRAQVFKASLEHEAKQITKAVLQSKQVKEKKEAIGSNLDNYLDIL